MDTRSLSPIFTAPRYGRCAWQNARNDTLSWPPYTRISKTIIHPNRPGVACTVENDEPLYPNDSIAKLLVELFPSPDGVQMTPNTRKDDAIGNLSRNLEAVDGIISVLLSKKKDAEKIKLIGGKDKDQPGVMPVPAGSNNFHVKNATIAKLIVHAYNRVALQRRSRIGISDGQRF